MPHADVRAETPAEMRARAKRVRQLMNKIIAKSDHDRLREYVENLELRAALAEGNIGQTGSHRHTGITACARRID